MSEGIDRLAWFSGLGYQYTSLCGAIWTKCTAPGIIAKDIMRVFEDMSIYVHILIRLYRHMCTYTVHMSPPT